MPSLCVENVPEELYNALRRRAREKRRSIAAEVIALLEENLVTDAELRSRQQFLRQIQRLRSRPPASRGPFPSTEEMQRQQRGR